MDETRNDDFVVTHRDTVELLKSGRGWTKTMKESIGRGSPTIQLRHWGPDTNIPIHHHPFNEMFYVLEGEIEIDGTTYPAGSCIYIAKGVKYGPTKAPKGGVVLRYAEGRPVGENKTIRD
jgi:mannose-6-phosphate isomerase-like protein (cupin superfamily)